MAVPYFNNQPQPCLHQQITPPNTYPPPPITHQPLQPPQTYQQQQLTCRATQTQPRQQFLQPNSCWYPATQQLHTPPQFPSYTNGPTVYSGYELYKQRIPQPPDPGPPYGVPTYGLPGAHLIHPVGQPPDTGQPAIDWCPLPSHQHSAAPLPAAAVPLYRGGPMEAVVVPDEAVVVGEVQDKSCSEAMLFNRKSYDGDEMLMVFPPSPAAISLPCSPNVRGEEGELLDDEGRVGILTDSSPFRRCLKIQEFCFRARSEALECMPTGLDNWATADIFDVNALMIYCPRRLRILGILGVHEVDASAINSLATHGPVWTNIGSIDCRKKYCVFDPGGLANKGAIVGIDEETFHLSGLELIDGVVLINQCVICASFTNMCLENGSIGNVKKVAASFNDARVSSYDVVEDGCVKQGGVSLCAFLGDKIAYGLPQDWMKIASLYVDVYVSDVDSINHRSTLFETDARLIPPHTDMLCLNIVGRVDELPILALHCSEPKSPPLMIFDGGDEGRRFPSRCAFDPGGNSSPKLLFATLLVMSWFPP